MLLLKAELIELDNELLNELVASDAEREAELDEARYETVL